jgi:hypothetical protein
MKIANKTQPHNMVPRCIMLLLLVFLVASINGYDYSSEVAVTASTCKSLIGKAPATANAPDCATGRER